MTAVTKFKNKFIGDKAFYAKVIAVALPIMIQNGITNFVSMLDNIMVGQIGTEQMSGVSIANQLFFVFNLCLFGGYSGVGIFTSQFYGKKDTEGIRHAVRFKVYVGAVLTALALVVFGFFGRPLAAAFLHESESGGDLEKTLGYAMEYIRVIMIGIVPFAITQMYSSTLRETEKTIPPMVCGITAVFVNLVLNYLLIFGKFGFPQLGAVGAAIATVVSRYVECITLVAWTHMNHAKNPFIVGVYRTLKIPKNIAASMAVKGLPLLINEALWSLGMTVLAQRYSMRGLDVVGAYNISSTITNVFNIVFISLGNAISIILGTLLGASKMKEAKDTSSKLLAFTFATSAVVAAVMASLSGVFPHIYNTEDSVRSLAAFFIVVSACAMPVDALANGLYFTLRSGGKTWITFLFDSAFVWCVNVSVATVLTKFTSLSIYPIFAICTAVNIIKVIIGSILVHSGTWLQNIVKDD